MDLLKDNIRSLYFKFLIPSLGSAMVMSVYTLTDAVVIGKGVGADALAALSITTPLLCILMATGILFGVGGSVQMNVHRGAGEEKKANQYFTLSLICMIVITALLWIIYATAMGPLLRLMGANDTLFPYAMAYMKKINMFLPAAVFSNFIAIFIRADHDPNRAMAGVICGGILNIILDIVFVFPLQMGIAGAAFASALGMLLQVLVGGSHFISKKNEMKFVMPGHILKGIGVIVANGIPSFFNEFANGFIVLLFNVQILKYCGASALSVYSVVSNCVILFNSLFTGVGQAIHPVVSTNFGAGNMERIRAVKKMSFITIAILGVVFSLSGIFFPELVCGIFLKPEGEILALARVGIRHYFWAFLPMALNVLTGYYLQSILQAKRSLCISLLRNIVLSTIFILGFPIWFAPESLWWVMPVVEVLVLALSIFWVKEKATPKKKS